MGCENTTTISCNARKTNNKSHLFLLLMPVSKMHDLIDCASNHDRKQVSQKPEHHCGYYQRQYWKHAA